MIEAPQATPEARDNSEAEVPPSDVMKALANEVRQQVAKGEEIDLSLKSYFKTSDSAAISRFLDQLAVDGPKTEFDLVAIVDLLHGLGRPRGTATQLRPPEEYLARLFRTEDPKQVNSTLDTMASRLRKNIDVNHIVQIRDLMREQLRDDSTTEALDI